MIGPLGEAIDLRPPLSVARNAERGLELRAKFRRGGTEVGARRARQLASREPVPVRDIVHIAAYFARHAVDKQSKSHVWGDLANPSAGYVAWLLWGGDEGEAWAKRMKARAAKARAG